VVQHLALLPLGTNLVGLSTGASALSGTIAGLVGRAVAVLFALYLSVRTGQRPLVVDNQTVLALADGLVIRHHTLLVAVAEERTAGVEALARVAVASRRSAAIAVLLAPADRRLLFFFDDSGRAGRAGRIEATADVGLADVALRALAARLVQHHVADGVVSAGRSPAAGVHTAGRQAGQVGRAVHVCVAAPLFLSGALNQRIPIGLVDRT